MALYDVPHSCGHTQQHNITGTNVHGERERKAQWLADGTCSDCYRAEQAAKRTATAAAHIDLTNLPRLTGSERQIGWAEKIRVDGIARIVREVNDPPSGYNKAVAAVMTGHIAVLSGPALELLDAAGKAEVTE
ncbi:MAG TPA: hypothetical protein VFE14_05745, partial [Micromonosporaceae bacterium]|nr:hypothetical protein [Micromonosporaceae bacterium]